MTQLTTDSSALRTFVAIQRSAATDTAADADRQRSAVLDLAIAFGMIGAEFLSAVVHVINLYTQNLERSAEHHDALSTNTERADATYTDRDRGSGSQIADTEVHPEDIHSDYTARSVV